MDFISNKFRHFTNYFVKKVEENKDKKGSKYDVYFEEIYKVLTWEDNNYTLMVFLVLHLIFWLIVQWQIRFLGIFFTFVLLIFLYDTYLETKDITAYYRGKYSDTFDEIRSYMRDITLNLKALRKESPSSFCIGMSLIFLTVSFVAKSMSGYLVIYLTMLSIFFVPLTFKFLPPEYSESLKNLLRSLRNGRVVLAEEELIPFISNDYGNKDNDLDSLLTDRTADSQTNSLLSGMSTMPSYMDVADIQDDIAEEDLIPNTNHRTESFPPSTSTTYTTGDGLSLSDSDSDPRDIHFEAAQFNRKGIGGADFDNTSSSEDDEDEHNFGSGLRFTAVATVSDFIDGQRKDQLFGGGSSGILSNFAAIGTTLVANALKSATASVSANQQQSKTTTIERKNSNSSSDSEFEIVNTDDVNE